MPRIPIDYSKCVMYKIVSRSDDIDYLYIGHTTQFTTRKSSHKVACVNKKGKRYNIKLYQTIRQCGGWDNFKMILIENYPCENKRQAEKREDELMLELKATMNTRRAYRSKKEWTVDNIDRVKETKKQWYEDNKNKISEQSKLYYINNKDKCKERMQEYQQNNKEKITEARHNYYEANKESILNKQKQYGKDNADIINKRNKTYRDTHAEQIKARASEKIECACGGTHDRHHKARHARSKKHLQYIESI